MATAGSLHSCPPDTPRCGNEDCWIIATQNKGLLHDPDTDYVIDGYRKGLLLARVIHLEQCPLGLMRFVL